MNIIFIVEDNGVQQEIVNIPVVQNIEPVNCETDLCISILEFKYIKYFTCR